MGAGYFESTVCLTFTPDAVGEVTLSMLQNGVELPGASVTVYAATADQPITLCLPYIVRNCGCDCSSILSAQISAAGIVNNCICTVNKL